MEREWWEGDGEGVERVWGGERVGVGSEGREGRVEGCSPFPGVSLVCLVALA